MVRIRRSPPSPVLDLHRRMEQVMAQLLRDVQPLETPAPWTPRVDICESADGFVVTLEVAGVEREEIDIVVEDRCLRISGTRSDPSPSGCVRWHQMEIAQGRFERVLMLPQEVDPERITATHKDGYLHIRIPRDPLGG